MKLIEINKPPVYTVLKILLLDKTMKRNIIWATSSYAYIDERYYGDNGQMTMTAVLNMSEDCIQPRILKAQEEQQKRTRTHAEVFTPSWICNQMNNYLDEDWFGRKDVFNTQDGHEWTPTDGKIEFPLKGSHKWQYYVDSRRLEITCGEAPFIVSRYDASTGEYMRISQRIGLLDRKLRVVNENTDNEEDWVKWAIRAVQSVYGYEWQGDNLLIARINVLMTFVEYYQARWQKEPTDKMLKKLAHIIAWNFWQMDGLTGTVPLGKLGADPNTDKQMSMFDIICEADKPVEKKETPPCKVFDWRTNESLTYNSMRRENIAG